MGNILIVDDDSSLREVLEIALANREHSPTSASDITTALQFMGRERFDLIIADLRLGTESGLDLLQRIQEQQHTPPVLIITAYADNKTALQALRLGAKDYISKPFDVEEFLLQVDKLLEEVHPVEEEELQLQVQMQGQSSRILGESGKIQEVFSLVSRIAPTGINVLVTGESGTGKELIARAIHENSERREKPFQVINCGGVPEALVESELFGYRKGAFTGAGQAKAGLLEKTDQGTFLLDEIAELSPNLQVKLLRCVQDGTFTPLGSTETVQTDIRFIGASNRDVENEVTEGNLREDLFYRLSGVIVHLPPLREREDDLFLLAEHFLQRFCQEQNKSIKGFSTGAKQKLRTYHYPGNVRELENIIERAVALESGPYISPASLVIYEQTTNHPSRDREQVLSGELSLDQYLEKIDKEVLASALERTQGNKKKAAELVGLSFRQLRYRLSKHGFN
ncbi:MAG: sigma-54 dependent transcriptional regulator [Desulfohalobiaceae bacterium]|nr:sigma-54 dependent transcriptional regulator [Desulfohalobiaceae bacterium]